MQFTGILLILATLTAKLLLERLLLILQPRLALRLFCQLHFIVFQPFIEHSQFGSLFFKLLLLAIQLIVQAFAFLCFLALLFAQPA